MELQRRASYYNIEDIGHTSLNHNLNIIGKHETGYCVKCNKRETVHHVLLQHQAYNKNEKNPRGKTIHFLTFFFFFHGSSTFVQLVAVMHLAGCKLPVTLKEEEEAFS